MSLRTKYFKVNFSSCVGCEEGKIVNSDVNECVRRCEQSNTCQSAVFDNNDNSCYLQSNLTSCSSDDVKDSFIKIKSKLQSIAINDMVLKYV
jgi:hypothetical protein